uniref:Reverse transcriptase domain-containing protein n=1 Tax=Lepisosteus oculatus TaxID=7918 RepID=W5LW94_LEPOC
MSKLEQKVLFAQDVLLTNHNEVKCHTTLNLFAEAYQSLILSLKIRKTKILFQDVPDQITEPSAITIAGEMVEVVDHFPYLGSHLSQKATIEEEVQHRISYASYASISFGKLRHRVFENCDLKMETRIKVYKAVCIIALLYGNEAWVTYCCHLKTLERFHQCCFQRWEDSRTNSSVLIEEKMRSIEAMIPQNQLCWTGYYIRMPNSHLPKQVLYFQLS